MGTRQRSSRRQNGAKGARRTTLTSARTGRRVSVSTEKRTRRSNVSPVARNYEKSVEPEFRAMFSQWAATQGELTPEDIDQLLARVRAVVQTTPNQLDDHVGPFYDTTGLRAWAQMSRQALHQKIERNTLIACQLEDRSWVYPVWQFDGHATPRAELIQIWRALRGPSDAPHADPWTCALWMRTPHSELNDMTPVEWVDDEKPVEAVLTLARHDAARWAQ